MRQQEIKKGITIQTEDGQDAGLSGNAAVAAISQVVPSRVGTVDCRYINFLMSSI